MAPSSSSSLSSWFNFDDHLCVPVQSSSVQFLRSPDQFYNTLLQRIASAKRRVVLSALYLGTDALEQRLVDGLTAAVTERRQRPLSVAILLDYFRATRGTHTKGKSSTTMLAPLTANENVEVRLFHTPSLRGILKNAMSERTNEVFGLQHMKFFVFDDTVLITGANLSDQYFVNRQDRYLLIENCPLLADFFVALFRLIGDHSFRLGPDGRTEFPGGTTSPVHPETGSIPHIQRQIAARVSQLFANFKAQAAKAPVGEEAKQAEGEYDDGTTFVVPFLQMGLFNVNQEVELLTKLFSTNSSNQNSDDVGLRLRFTLITAYFNLADAYADILLHKCHSPTKIVFASPMANGFLGADGLSGYIPSLYEHAALAFVRRAAQAHQTGRLAFAEWSRPGWTFHAKGIWMEEWRQQFVAAGGAADTAWRGGRVATVVGSSNFGCRSVQRDLEAQLMLVTDNEELKGRISEEKNSLLAHSEVLDPSTFLRRDLLIPGWLKLCARLFRTFF